MLEPDAADAEADQPIIFFCTGFEEVVFRKSSLHFVCEKLVQDLRGVEL